MLVALTIEDVPDDVAVRLRERARRNHRSLNGELLAIIAQATAEARPGNGVREVRALVRQLDLPRRESSVEMIRRMRDGGEGKHNPRND
jgi:plasmid stability protein